MLNYTEQEYIELTQRTKAPHINNQAPPACDAGFLSPMNKLETAYSQYLDALKFGKDIVDYRFEPFKLILVHGVPHQRNETSYKPDFLVIKDVFEIHEVKGFWRDDARIKLKMAAQMFPWFKFFAVTKKKGLWVWERI